MTFETMTTESNLPETLKLIEKMTTEQAFQFLGLFLMKKAEEINLKDDEIRPFVECIIGDALREYHSAND